MMVCEPPQTLRRIALGVAAIATLASLSARAQSGAQPTPQAQCLPAGQSRAALLELKAQEFKLDATSVQTLVIALIPCLADPDPELRDGVAFEAMSKWLRGRQVKPETATKLMTTLQQQLIAASSKSAGKPVNPDSSGANAANNAGFAAPFAALVLADVVRMDRIEPFLTARHRTSLANSSAAYLKSVTDYRGFDASSGWRHGVAHSADLLMQLAINQRVDKTALDANLDAIAAQVAPAREHFYIYGEPTRLATAAFYTAQRHLHSAEEWTKWCQTIVDPAPLANWTDAFTSQAGLAKRHNTLTFLQALYTLTQENGDSITKERLLPAIQKAIEAVW